MNNNQEVFTKNEDESWKVSGISSKYPSYRNNWYMTTESWLQGRREDDEAEGLWRIHDTLYDFTDFIKRHPGGTFWLEETKGMDITEHFETHHLTTAPELMLAKYKVRNAKKPRIYNFTMHENGFYKTLKRRVRDKLKTIDYSPKKRTDFMLLGLVFAVLSFTIASAITSSYIYMILAGLSISWLANAAHNFFHRKDNWQMYTFNFSLLNFTSWRISHALSHHAFTNSLLDLEMSLMEPFLCWIPNVHIAGKLRRIFSVTFQPFIYMVIFPGQFLTRVCESLLSTNVMYWHDVIGFTLPALMLLVSHAPVLEVLRQWCVILAAGGFIFGLIGLNAAHHDPKIFHDGDTIRGDRDWGLFQIDTIIDRKDVKCSQFLVLTHFGEHVLHHLFPTLDHGLLPQLYPELMQTMKEFQVEFRECNGLEHIIGQSQQLLRTDPNPLAPGEKKKVQ